MAYTLASKGETWSQSPFWRQHASTQMRCLRRAFSISYTEHFMNEAVRATITKHMKRYEELLTTVKKRKLRWRGHVTRASGLSKTVLQGTGEGGRRRARQRQKWTDNIAEWTGKSFATTQALVHDRQRWRQEGALPRPNPLPITVRGGDREELCHDPSPCP